MIEVAVIGFGTVGSGVVDILENNKKQIEKKVPGGVHVKYIVDIREFPDSPYRDRIVKDFDQVISDPEVKVICETMGGKEPARTFTEKALQRGISVCTSNKELVQAFGPSLLKTAAEHDCSYLFEASVGGGIPLIRTMLEGLAQEDIKSIMGVLNGTTNYILTEMELSNKEYSDALAEAQALGYAERNPAADVEGHDTGRKISILASLRSGKNVSFDKIYVEGITRISPKDFLYARANGYAIRLLGLCQEEEDGFTVMVAPFLVEQGHPLYAVEDVFNAVLFHGTMVDDVMFYGRGAGKLPTGSAVVADVLHAAMNVGHHIPIAWSLEELTPRAHEKHVCPFLVRAKKQDEHKVLTAFAGQVKKVLEIGELTDEFGFFTLPMREDAFETCAAGLDLLGRVRVLA